MGGDGSVLESGERGGVINVNQRVCITAGFYDFCLPAWRNESETRDNLPAGRKLTSATSSTPTESSEYRPQTHAGVRKQAGESNKQTLSSLERVRR